MNICNFYSNIILIITGYNNRLTTVFRSSKYSKVLLMKNGLSLSLLQGSGMWHQVVSNPQPYEAK